MRGHTLPSGSETPGASIRKWWRRLRAGDVSSGEMVLLLRRPVIAALHALLIVVAWVGSFAVRLEFSVTEPFRSAMVTMLPGVIVIKLVVFYAYRLFQG